MIELSGQGKEAQAPLGTAILMRRVPDFGRVERQREVALLPSLEEHHPTRLRIGLAIKPLSHLSSCPRHHAMAIASSLRREPEYGWLPRLLPTALKKNSLLWLVEPPLERTAKL